MTRIARTVSIVVTLTATGAALLGGFTHLDVLADGGDQDARTVVLDMSAATPIAPVADVAAQETPAAAPLTDREQELVDWAVDRFAQAGLELPEMTVRFDPTRELCGHAQGRFQQASDGERFVTICTRDGDSFAADLDRRRTLLHEFGHAWDFANLSDDDRAGLAGLLGAEAWNDPEAAWEDRGVERFAEAFVYALLDQPRRQVKVALGCEDLVGAFEAATGAVPQGPGLPYCVA